MLNPAMPSTCPLEDLLHFPRFNFDERKVPEGPTGPRCVQSAGKPRPGPLTTGVWEEIETSLFSHLLDLHFDWAENWEPARSQSHDCRLRNGKTLPSPNLTGKSPVQKRLPTTTSIPEVPLSQRSLQHSNLIIEAGRDSVIPESFSITPKPQASENS